MACSDFLGFRSWLAHLLNSILLNEKKSVLWHVTVEFIWVLCYMARCEIVPPCSAHTQWPKLTVCAVYLVSIWKKLGKICRFFFFLKDPWNWPKPPHFCCYEPKWRTSCVLLSIASWDIFVGLQICPLPPKFYFVCWEVNLTSGAEFSKHSKSPIWVFADGNALTVAIYDNDKEMKQFHQMVILHILKVDIFSTHYAFYSSLGHWDQNPIVIVKAL